ncbi:TIGR03943 family putative permease subunit [Brevibacillus fluminis]|uniref:TIGR03943 family putative permease subunit n=1 Tax=Brevibacillus fluminis TaxID=511487 RepID=UPI003F8BEBAC
MRATFRRHYFLRSYILLGFTVLLTRLLITGDIQYYLAPRLHMLCHVTLGIMLLLTIASLTQALTGAKANDCDCGGDHGLPRGLIRSTLFYGLFIVPLAMGFLLPHKILGSELAQKKGVNLLAGNAKELIATQSSRSPNKAGSSAPAQPDGTMEPARSPTPQQTKEAPKQQSKKLGDAEIRKLFQSNNFGDYYTEKAMFMYKQPIITMDDKLFLDGLTILDLYPKEFEGHELETTGFVYRQPDFSDSEFVAARFTVSCCTADATVAGVLVEAQNAKAFATDSWVKIKGTLTMTSLNGSQFLMLKAERITPVKAPKTPYVYLSGTGAGTANGP